MASQAKKARPKKAKNEPPPIEAALDPEAAAKQAKLRYVSDTMPGITRHQARNGFDYRLPDGALVRDIDTLRRIRSLAIPPAWTDAWICLDPNGHLQATGRDARGRKQYRYHPRWREVRDEAKYTKLLVFARCLSQIRVRIEKDLKRRGLPRERVLAAIVRLMEMTFFRVGNTEYARQNKSFGLTTLRDRHVAIEGGRIHISFRGKSGKQHETDINDRRLARIVKGCRDLPGYELFQYIDDDGERRTVDSADVNEYLREITGEDITAKDFRTWAATHLAAQALCELDPRAAGPGGPSRGEAKRKKAIVDAVKKVAQHLGNTPAICRRSYIHPAVLDGYLDGTLLAALADQAQAYLEENIHGMKPEETAVTAFLRLRLGELAKESRAA
jgi:DNA topoisomerase I